MEQDWSKKGIFGTKTKTKTFAFDTKTKTMTSFIKKFWYND